MQNEQLRKVGLKVTLPRVKILALLERNGKRLVSAEDKNLFTIYLTERC